MTKLSIIVINYNTGELTLTCVKSIAEFYKKQLEDREFEIILVDNRSTDDSLQNLEKEIGEKPYIRFVKSKENLGFGGGNNLGAKNSNGKFLFFLNSDTEIKDEGLVKMVNFLESNQEVGILGGKLKNIDGSNQNSAGRFYNLPTLFFVLIGFERLGFVRKSPSKIRKMDWVSGASLMIRKEIFEKVGGFDEKLFMYMEDMDLCYSVNKLECKTFFYPFVSIIHKERGSSNKTFAILNIYKGVKYMYKKHMPGWRYQTALLFLKTKALSAIMIGYLVQNKNLVLTYKKAIES